MLIFTIRALSPTEVREEFIPYINEYVIQLLVPIRLFGVDLSPYSFLHFFIEARGGFGVCYFLAPKCEAKTPTSSSEVRIEPGGPVQKLPTYTKAVVCEGCGSEFFWSCRGLMPLL